MVPWRHNAFGGPGRQPKETELVDTTFSPLKDMEVDKRDNLYTLANICLDIGTDEFDISN
jgi:hypothetical protein